MFLKIRRPPRYTQGVSSAASDVYKRQVNTQWERFDSYSQGLAVVIRNDYEVVDPDAARIVDITPVKA
ncbi:phage major capsid protein [Lactobacillus casei subsp. casei ATCC 393] [Lacticaseibacillus rhamnosus]|nr:phage major capsid protein [Lactobacillus casei subsp. casei ATCC 393] [Lacticaseibacillus rhamnosus]